MAEPKYKAGDYICNPSTVFLKVHAVVAKGATQPVYLLGGRHIYKGDYTDWSTEYECGEQGYTKAIPDFDLWDSLKPGDIIKTGQSDERGYVNVIARVDNAVLLSGEPHDHEDSSIDKLTKQLAELAGADLEDATDRLRNDLRKHGSMKHQHQVAVKWTTTEQLALMNWVVVKE